MKKEKYEEILNNLELPKEKWLTLTEFSSIILNNGIGIYPNWLHMRFLLLDNEIIIKYGESQPYGARLGNRFLISNDLLSIQFPPESIIAPSVYYSTFRAPKSGDIIRSTIGTEKVISESVVENSYNGSNTFLIEVSSPIKLPKEARLSFYDPKEYNIGTCIHGTEAEGIFMKFKENNGKSKKYGIQHQIIKIKEIQEINLKLSIRNKTYKII